MARQEYIFRLNSGDRLCRLSILSVQNMINVITKHVSDFATDELVNTQVTEKGNRNSKKTTYWINLLEKEKKLDPELTY